MAEFMVMVGTTTPDHVTYTPILAKNASNDGPDLEAVTPFNFDVECMRAQDCAA